jgi:hypothetical protein
MSMSDADYQALVKAAFIKFVALHEQRTNVDTEIAKLRQFIFAAGNMLPDKERDAVIAEMALIKEAGQIRDASLSEATRTVLEQCGRKWLTVREVRDRLESSGFDFTGYTANPLASVSTTLKRMKGDEVESTVIEGVTAYRWKLRRKLSQEKIRDLANKL